MVSVLGVDVGTVRVGLAACDPTGIIASPAGMKRRDDPAMWDAIAGIIRERSVELVVVGLPRNLDGSEGASAEMARAFGDELTRRTGVGVELWDERFTTAAAERSLIEGGMRRRRRREMVDTVAATLMLQNWLDARRPGR